MKLFSALAALTLIAAPVQAAGDAHSKCAQVADYAGCMQVQTHGVASSQPNSLSNLRNAMKQVAARLSAGTSLRDSSEVFRPVTDALALVSGKDQDSLAYEQASRAARLFGLWQSAWDTRIQAQVYGYQRYGMEVYICSALKQSADAFDRAAGTNINWNYKKGLLGGHSCKVRAGQLPEQYMGPVVIQALERGSIDPVALAKQEAEQKRAQELAEMEAWERHLEEQPALKAWAKANPNLAAQKRKEWNAANPIVTGSVGIGKQSIDLSF